MKAISQPMTMMVTRKPFPMRSIWNWSVVVGSFMFFSPMYSTNRATRLPTG